MLFQCQKITELEIKEKEVITKNFGLFINILRQF